MDVDEDDFGTVCKMSVIHGDSSAFFPHFHRNLRKYGCAAPVIRQPARAQGAIDRLIFWISSAVWLFSLIIFSIFSQLCMTVL